jgi:hypothetical protein
VSLLLRPATGPLGRNATREEEAFELLTDYVAAGRGGTFNVILVDGYARSACLNAARSLIAPGGVIFLHDSQRSWYDDAKASLQAWGTIGSCDDYPIPQLWYGSTRAIASPGRGADPVIVSYYTIGSPYEEEAARLEASCRTWQLTADIAARPPRDSWEANCALKAEVCLEAWHRHRRPILWVDADARIEQPPTLLRGCEADFAVHRWHGWQVASGTVFFNQTPLALELLTHWVQQCRRDPSVWDQVSLDAAWESITASRPLATLWLPQAYCHIFDRPLPDGDQPVVTHYQASRRFKTQVTAGPPRPQPHPSAALVGARLAARTRRWALPGADSRDFDAEVQHERQLDAQPHQFGA